jgi:hypothetical protein
MEEENRGTGRSMMEGLKGRWEWNEECVKAKKKVIEEIKKDVMLYRPDEGRRMNIYVDYSEVNRGIAAVLTMELDEGDIRLERRCKKGRSPYKYGVREVPVMYISRKVQG